MQSSFGSDGFWAYAALGIMATIGAALVGTIGVITGLGATIGAILGAILFGGITAYQTRDLLFK